MQRRVNNPVSPIAFGPRFNMLSGDVAAICWRP
jgi:hypothetical protein